MTERLELPNGDVVTPGEVFLYEGYPYRFVPRSDDRYEFVLSPLYWGESELDVPFSGRDALVDQWSEESRGTLSPEEWAAWIEQARGDDRFDDTEIDALARELPVDGPPGGDDDGGLLARLRRLLGL
jgi:hypothetical protein